MNLACKAVLAQVTDMDFASAEARDFNPDYSFYESVFTNISRDVIAMCRTAIRLVRILRRNNVKVLMILQIRASNVRRNRLEELLRGMQMAILQLLLDVTTRWSSTLLMIIRYIELREVCRD